MLIPVPTRRGKILIALTILSLMVAMVNANLSTALIASILSATMFSSYIFSFFAIGGIELIREPSNDAVMGEAITLPLKIVNRIRRPRQTFIIQEQIPFIANSGNYDLAVNALKGKEEREIERSITPNRRGSYNLSKITLVGGDSLGLFKVTRYFHLPTTIVIYPQTVRISQISLDRESKIMSHGTPMGVSERGEDIFGLRDYRQGDPIRLINWKSSAKQHKLVVKEFESHTLSKVNILLDVESSFIGDHAIYNNFEYLISTAGSIARYLSGAYCNMSLIVGEKDKEDIIASGSASNIENKMMDILAEIKPSDITISNIIDRNMHLFEPNSVLYCLTLCDNESCRHILNNLIEKGVDVRWLYAPKESFPKDIAETTKRENKNQSKINIDFPVPYRVQQGMHIEDAITRISR